MEDAREARLADTPAWPAPAVCGVLLMRTPSQAKRSGVPSRMRRRGGYVVCLESGMDTSVIAFALMAIATGGLLAATGAAKRTSAYRPGAIAATPAWAGNL